MDLFSFWKVVPSRIRALLLVALSLFLLSVLFVGYRVRVFYASEIQSAITIERIRVIDAITANTSLFSTTLQGLRGFFLGSQEVTEEEWFEYVTAVQAQTIEGSRGLYYVTIDFDSDEPVITQVFSYSAYQQSLFDRVEYPVRRAFSELLADLPDGQIAFFPVGSIAEESTIADLGYVVVPIQQRQSFLVYRIDIDALLRNVSLLDENANFYRAHFFVDSGMCPPISFAIDGDTVQYFVAFSSASSPFVSSGLAEFFDGSISVELIALPEYWRSTSYHIVPPLLWGGGVIVGFLMVAGVLILFYSRQEAVVLARRLTRDMRDKMQELEQFHFIVDNASDHIVITDSDGVVLYANNAVERTTGYTKKEIIGNIPRLWGGQMSKQFYQKMWDIIKNKKEIFSGQLTNKRKNGDLYEAEARVAPIMDSNGHVKFFIGIERDISEEKRIEASKTEFVSLASHQLRTPVSIINWYAEMLLQEDAGRVTKKQKEYLQQIHDASSRMGDLVKALLNVSRVEMGTISVVPQEMDIEIIVKEVLQDWKITIDKKQLAISYSKAPSVPLIWADPVVAKIIIDNIISNAVKYTPEKGSVRVRLYIEKDNLVVEVNDDGFGIPASQQNNVFSKFFRADNIAQKDTTGTGLGLYLTKEILSIVGGSIRFVSQENEGTTFFIYFPLKGMRAQKGIKELSV